MHINFKKKNPFLSEKKFETIRRIAYKENSFVETEFWIGRATISEGIPVGFNMSLTYPDVLYSWHGNEMIKSEVCIYFFALG